MIKIGWASPLFQRTNRDLYIKQDQFVKYSLLPHKLLLKIISRDIFKRHLDKV